MQQLRPGNPWPLALAPEGGFSNGDFSQQSLHRQIERWDRVRSLLLRVQSVRWQTQCERRGKDRFFGVMFQMHLELDGIRREMLEMSFQLEIFFLKFFFVIVREDACVSSRESISVS